MTCRSPSRSSSRPRRSSSSSRSSSSGCCGSGRCSRRTRTGRLLPRVLSAFFLSTPLRVVLQLVSVFVFVVTLATALLGTTTELLNFAPTFVYVIFWLGRSAALGALRERLARAQPVARHRGRRRLAPRARRPRGEARPPVERSLGPVSGRRRALLVRCARAHESKTGLPANPRDRDRPLLVLGACGHGGVRSRSLVARRRGLRRDVRAVLAHRAVRRPRRPRRRALAVHRPRGVRSGRRSAAVRRRDDRLDELRRLLADRQRGKTSSATSARISPTRLSA